MKEIRDAIKKYGDSQLSGNPTDWFKGLDQAEAEIKKIVLGWVGKLHPYSPNIKKGIKWECQVCKVQIKNRDCPHNQVVEILRKKVEGEL